MAPPNPVMRPVRELRGEIALAPAPPPARKAAAKKKPAAKKAKRGAR